MKKNTKETAAKQSNPKAIMGISFLDRDLLDRAKAAAKRDRRSLSNWIVGLVRADLEKHGHSQSASPESVVDSVASSVAREVTAPTIPIAGTAAKRVPARQRSSQKTA